jgi:flagellar hook-associated protein 1
MSMIFNGLSGVVASQVVLNTVSQNLANALTPNYTRQGVVLTAKAAVNSSLSAGNGVAATSLVRYADSYKTQQMWRANATLGQHEAGQTYLLQLEQVMGDTGSNLSVSLDNFFAALSAASVEPASTPLRQQIIEQAKALGQSVGNLAQIISNQKAAVTQQREVAVDQLNSYTTQIAALNAKIIQAKGAGLNTSALEDQRDAQVDGLSKLVGLQTMTQPDGSINLSLRGGQPLVVGDRASHMEVTSDAQGFVMEVHFGAEKFALQSADWQGTLGGLAALETDVLNPIDSAVRAMASTIANEVNAVLNAGFGTQGTQPSPDLFVLDSASSAGLLTVNPLLTPDQLGLSDTADEAGNSEQLQKLIALQQKPVTIPGLGNGILFGDVYTQLVGKLGTYSQQSIASYSTAKTVRDQSESNWKSTSAVNTDEEAVNLMQYQQMYQANMKVISTANELFDSLLALN